MLIDNLFTLRSGIGFVLTAATLAVMIAIPRFRTMNRRRLVAATTGLLAFQAFHFLEHLIQLVYWVAHPRARPYMTPWAVDGLEGLSLWSSPIPGSGTMMLRGMELLHLIGNLVFLAGLVALGAAARRHRPALNLHGLKLATMFQTAHVAEHVLLTLSVFAIGQPLGLSTLFGLSEGTAWGGTVRVWFHFLINLAGSVPAIIAIVSYRRQTSATREPQQQRSLALVSSHTVDSR